MPEDYVIVYVGADAQPLTDQIKIGGKPLDLGSSDVYFKMREAETDVLKVNASATVDDSTLGKISYNWIDTDIDTQGQYYAWWHIDTGSGEINTNEFLVIVAEHAPGLRTRTGAIYEQAKGIIPITWNGLEDSPEYGDALLQRRVEVVKEIVLGSGVTPAQESSLNIVVQQHLAKQVVLQIIPAGVDYWLSKPIQISTAPTQELISYQDRVKSLWEIYEMLLKQVAEEQDIIDELLDTPQTRSNVATPEFSPAVTDGFKTPVASDFYDYAFPETYSPWES